MVNDQWYEITLHVRKILCHKPTPSHHHSYGWYKTIAKWIVYDIVLPALHCKGRAFSKFWRWKRENHSLAISPEVEIGGHIPLHNRCIDLIYGRYLQSIGCWRLGSNMKTIYELGMTWGVFRTLLESPLRRNEVSLFHHAVLWCFMFFLLGSSRPLCTIWAMVKTWYMAFGHPLFIMESKDNGTFHGHAKAY